MIYIITCGEYSDYQILTATTDHEYAVKFKDEYNSCADRWSEADIKIYEDNALTQLIPYKCCFKDGEVYECKVSSYPSNDIRYYEKYKTGFCNVSATNKDEAVKIAAERMAKYRMENK